jgi:hypothetical protein
MCEMPKQQTKGLPRQGKKQNLKKGKGKAAVAGTEQPKRKTKEEAKAQREAAQRGLKRGVRWQE